MGNLFNDSSSGEETILSAHESSTDSYDPSETLNEQPVRRSSRIQYSNLPVKFAT